MGGIDAGVTERRKRGKEKGKLVDSNRFLLS
jgi:hypothetical protein